jgi:hypothetical protein
MIALRFRLAFIPLLGLGLACSGSPGGTPSAKAAPQETPAASPSPSPSPVLEGQDFGPEARLLFKVVACAGDEPVPQGLDKGTLDAHCAWLKTQVDKLKTGYLAKAEPFLTNLRPKGLPTTLVYPFGGGDLLSALTSFPDATDISTISLEHAGDPRRVHDVDKVKLKGSLDQLERRIRGLFAYNESTSENLMQMQRGELPGQLSFFLVGLAVHGFEPVSLRYFKVNPDGTLHYFTTQEIAADEKKMAKKLRWVWVSPDFSEDFSNMELTFRPQGGGPLRVHRHFALDLSDDHLKDDPAAIRYLETKGEISAMTKAASYLIWNPGFSTIRDYLLKHMVFMFSDSTGIPPKSARDAGFVQDTYGRYTGPFLPANKAVSDDFRKLWASQPLREMDFRYGYPDAGNWSHLVVTRRPGPGDQKAGSPQPPAKSPS